MDASTNAPSPSPPTPAPTSPASETAPTASAAPPAQVVAPGLAGRLVPIALVVALGGGNAWLWRRDAERSEKLEKRDNDLVVVREENRLFKENYGAMEGRVKSLNGDLRQAQEERQKLVAELAAAKQGGTDEQARRDAERAALEKKLADLADKLGESEAARTAAETRAKDLDQVMDGLKKKRVNARRLAGLEAPPRVTAEVVSVDSSRVPPLLVLRVRDSLAGLEEGDVLYLARGDEGSETGRVVLERVDPERRLLQARVQRLDAGEKLAIGDKLSTVAPASK